MKESKTIPPKLATRLLNAFLRYDLTEEVEGDLEEKFYANLKTKSKFQSKLNYWLQVLNYLRPFAIKKSNTPTLNHIDMFKNYWIIGWRNLIQSKLFSLIKISGLSMGIAACLLITLFTKDELSYDQFHENKNNIYRVVQLWHYGSDVHNIGTTNAIVGEAFAKEIPEIQQFVRVNGVAVNLKMGDNITTENPLFVDPNFLSVFSFKLLEGDPKTALKELHSVVISSEIATKYFGTTDVLGKSIEIKLGDNIAQFEVTALIENSIQNSTLKTDILIPFQYFETTYNNNSGWIGGSLNTFLLLRHDAAVSSVINKMQALFDTHTKDQIVEAEEKQNVKIKIDLALQSLTDIHLGKPGPDNGMIDGSDSSYSYTLSGIALFILIIACINFINLAVSQSMKRAKEIGIRKVVGGSRAQLIRQFLVESFIIICIAFGIALLLTVVLIPSFNTLADKKLNLEYLSDAYLFVGFGILLLVTTFLAGIYPSLVLSSPQPIKVLYGRHKLMGKNYITRSLIVVQFALAIFLVINTLVINAQMNFLYQANLGYDSRNLVRVNIPVSKTSDLLPTQFKNELLGNKNIVSVAARHGGRSISGVMVNGKMIEIENNKIDDQFLATFKIPIIVGRNFSPDFPSDSLHGVIVNEAFLKEAGWRLDESVGKTINFLATGKQPAAIVGIIKDYHFVSLKEKIKPALFSMNPDFNFGQIWIRVNPDDIPETLTLIEKTFKKLVPYYPYTYQFMDDLNAANYKAETKSKHILMISSGLFIFISCIGLFGLVILSIEQRTKEIGIRKVLGAAVTRVAGLISKQFVILIGIAFVVSVPLAYMTLDKWLNKFAYHVDMPWWLFAIAGSSTIGLSLLIIGVQSIKAALANPVDSLRSE